MVPNQPVEVASGPDAVHDFEVPSATRLRDDEGHPMQYDETLPRTATPR